MAREGWDVSTRIYRCFATGMLGAILFTSSALAQSHLELKVHTGHGFNGYDVNSTMISGEKDMIVIDPQFSLSEAHKLAAEILESKKNLTTIYITHPHPDHLFGLAVLKQAKPERQNSSADRNRQCSENRMAGPSEVLAPDIRKQHSRTGSRGPGGVNDAGPDAGG